MTNTRETEAEWHRNRETALQSDLYVGATRVLEYGRAFHVEQLQCDGTWCGITSRFTRSSAHRESAMIFADYMAAAVPQEVA